MSQTSGSSCSVSIDHRPIREVPTPPVVPILRQPQRFSGGFARQYQWGCWRVIEGTGDLDVGVVPLLRGLTVGAPLHVIFDLRQVTFLDACVLGVLVGTRAHQDRAHSAVRLVGPSPMVRKMIAITSLGSVLPIFESLEHAAAGHESC